LLMHTMTYKILEAFDSVYEYILHRLVNIVWHRSILYIHQNHSECVSTFHLQIEKEFQSNRQIKAVSSSHDDLQLQLSWVLHLDDKFRIVSIY